MGSEPPKPSDPAQWLTLRYPERAAVPIHGTPCESLLRHHVFDSMYHHHGGFMAPSLCSVILLLDWDGDHCALINSKFRCSVSGAGRVCASGTSVIRTH